MGDYSESPPHKRRRTLMAVQLPKQSYSDIMNAFGASSSPSSVSKMQRRTSGRNPRGNAAAPIYIDDDDEASTEPSPKSDSDFGDNAPPSPSTQEEEGDDSDDDVIIVKQPPPRRESTRELPARSTRAQVDFAPPKRVLKSSSKKRKRGPTRLLTSDTVDLTGPQQKGQTSRRLQTRQNILETTKPKRDSFILAHKEYFLPLLPTTNYITKLARAREGETAEFVKYEPLTKQPKQVKAVMKDYQLEGLSFLVQMNKNGMSAILGDEMGLGKTLQTLSLFQYLAENDPAVGENRPNLVVCPLSVLSSWVNECKKWVPNLNIVRFHGPKKERDKFKADMLHRDDNIDVVITTYETFVAEQGWLKRAFAWRYCVLDEGHKIKNDATSISLSLQSLQAEFRLLLTGTPLQNNLHEMWALLHWLYPDVFTKDTADVFKRSFDLTRGQVSTDFMDHARSLLELVMLRRMKSSAGVNLGLPPKEEILLYVPLTPLQRYWYQALITKSDNALLSELFSDSKNKELKALEEEQEEDKQLSVLEQGINADTNSEIWAEQKNLIEQANATNEQPDGKKPNDWRKLMNLIMQLRKVCSHPYLLKGVMPDPYFLGSHIITATGKFIVLEKIVKELVIKQRKKILIFSGFTKTLDFCEDLLYLKGGNNDHTTCAFRYLRLDGGTPRAKRNLGIRMFNDPESEFKVMLISTRAGGLGINLASASDVIFLDEDWNPQITLQAEARAHRIGQTKPVTIYKICSQGTVEEQMMGRIRKKLYLSAKITESMENIHTSEHRGKKRKRGQVDQEDEGPQLDTSQLKSLLRKGAATLARPQVDINAMLGWDFETMVENCKDKADDPHVNNADGKAAIKEADEQEWLNSMEKVETALFEGKKHQRAMEIAAKEQANLVNSDRRIGKNTTVMVDGFAVNKESMNCGDWEAVPTFAGKDPRLAEPKREKKAAINHQDDCQACYDGGDIVLCAGCPRAYHTDCLDENFRPRATSKFQFYCPQHECGICEAKTAEAGGLIFRCRWCPNGFCEDCLDWDKAKLVGATLPELLTLEFGATDQAWFIECPTCVEAYEADPLRLQGIKEARANCAQEYEDYLAAIRESQGEEEADVSQQTISSVSKTSEGMKMDENDTPATLSEAPTPVNELAAPESKDVTDVKEEVQANNKRWGFFGMR